VDNRGNVLSENSEGDSLAGLSSTQLAARRNIEQYLSKKAEGLLEKVLGPGQAVVRVAAEINFETVNRMEEKFDPDGQVVRSMTINDENSDATTAGSNGGVPGVATNTGSETNAASASPLNNTHTRKKITNNSYEINKIVSNSMQAAGGLKRVSAAVFVAVRAEGTGAARKVVPRDPQELEKLRRIVQSALGIQSGVDATRNGDITLEEMPFNDQFSLDLTQQLVKDQKQQFWWSVARNSIYPLLACGILIFFWRLFQRTPAETMSAGVPLSHPSGGNGQENPALVGWEQSKEPPVVTVEVLNRLIRENPANMTQALQTWMARSKSNPK